MATPFAIGRIPLLGLDRSDIFCFRRMRSALWPCVRYRDPGSLDYTTWIGLTISGTKQPNIGNLPSRLTIPSSKTRCLNWRPCVKRSPIISRTISRAGNWSRASPVECEGRAPCRERHRQLRLPCNAGLPLSTPIRAASQLFANHAPSLACPLTISKIAPCTVARAKANRGIL